MSDSVRIELQPLDETLLVAPGTPLRDILFSYGVEFPCGGHGRCKRCRVKVLGGDLPITEEQAEILPASDLAAGWRLACRCEAETDLILEIAQWETPILADNSGFSFVARDGFGVAVDLGTTTLVAQLLDLKTAQVLSVQSELNPQVAYGADVMSRVQFGLAQEGKERLQQTIRQAIGGMIAGLLATAHRKGISLDWVVIVGNTVMHHLFCGVDVEPLSHYPFEPEGDGLQVFPANTLGWDLPGDPVVRFLPSLGGFVGSDILAGVLATHLAESDDLVGLVDLGTNGEIVIGNRRRLVCASTAAGPAFEGGRISCGMRAVTGAIAEVSVRDGALECHVLGNGAPRGICGSGLVDAVAVGLELGVILPAGRLCNGAKEMPLAPPVTLLQRDVRELQLAKGALAAGIEILLDCIGARRDDLRKIYLAGAFGNYINRASAQRIGLLRFAPEDVDPSGNTALLGAKLALFRTETEGFEFQEILSKTEHISLASHPRFQEIYVEEMLFPDPAG